MTQFPDIDLERHFSAAFGADVTTDPATWAFTDLSSRLLPVPITVRRAVLVGAQTTATSLATVTCDNTDGALTPQRATSPYWPYVDNGTPAQYQQRDRTDMISTFTAPAVSNGWPNADTGEAWTPATPSACSSNGTQAQITFPAVNVSRTVRTLRTDRDVEITFDVAVSTVPTGASLFTGPQVRLSGTGLYRLWCVVEFTTAGTIQLDLYRGFNTTSVTPVAFVTVPALTFSAGTLIRCVARIEGNRVRMRAWLAAGADPVTWHLDYTQTSSIVNGWNAALGATDRISMRADVLNTVTSTPPIVFTYDNVSIAQVASSRIRGYIADVRPTYTPLPGGEVYSTVEIDIAGVSSILETRDSSALGPLRRSVEKSDPPPIAYWPCEDDEGSTVAVSAFPDQSPMLVTGPATFAFSPTLPTVLYQSRYGTKPMVSVAAGAKLTGVVPPTAVQTEWAVSIVAQFYVPGVLPGISELRVLEWQTPGSTFNRWALVGTTTGYKVRAYNDAAGTSTDVITDVDGPFINPVTYTVEATQNGGNIDVGLFYNDNPQTTGSVAGTLTGLARMVANPDQANVTASIDPDGLRYIVGHMRVVDDTSVRDLPFYVDPDQGGISIQAGNAWFHESAHRRLARLHAEERIPFRLIGDPAAATAGITVLNTQQDGSFKSLITDAAESTSGGLLFEDAFGHAWLDRTLRYNLPAALVIDMTTYARTGGTGQTDVLVPKLDPRLPNSWTVRRANGAAGTYQADAAFRARRGTIGAEITVDVLDDTQPREHAAWRAHVNVDARDSLHPAVPLDLAAMPALIDSWLSCEIGSRVQRTNQPTVAGYNVVDQVILGITETIGPRTWICVLDAAPAAVWDVAVYDDPVRRKDSASTVTNASYAAGVGTIVFKTTNIGDLWSTTTEPYDCICAGVRFTVTVMGAASGTGPYLQTATVTRGVGGPDKTLPAGEPIHMHPDQLARYAL